MQDLSNRSWIFNGNREDYLNPADFMGIPNQEGITVYYDGTPIPPLPSSFLHSHFKCVLYANKLRKRRLKKYG